MGTLGTPAALRVQGCRGPWPEPAPPQGFRSQGCPPEPGPQGCRGGRRAAFRALLAGVFHQGAHPCGSTQADRVQKDLKDRVNYFDNKNRLKNEFTKMEAVA